MNCSTTETCFPSSWQLERKHYCPLHLSDIIMKSLNQFITSKVHKSIEGVLWQMAFIYLSTAYEQQSCLHSNPNHTIEGAFATSKELFLFLSRNDFSQEKGRYREYLIVPNDSMCLKNICHPPSVASSHLLSNSNSLRMTVRALSWSEPHRPPLTASCSPHGPH